MTNKPMLSAEQKTRKLGTVTPSDSYYVAECIKCGWVGSSEELSEDAQCLQPSGNDDCCYGDTDEIEAADLLMLLQDGAFNKPAAQHQGEPVAYLYRNIRHTLPSQRTQWEPITVEYARARMHNKALAAEGKADECLLGDEFQPLHAQQPAPVAVVIPFAEKVISKLRRFDECTSDGQDVDISREWFDTLTHLGLLVRVQRSPAYWEITQQGEDALAVTRLNTPQ